jgi:hypothetical protein
MTFVDGFLLGAYSAIILAMVVLVIRELEEVWEK